MGVRSYAQYRAEREKAHEEWLKRKKEREEKLARGEEVGPEEPDPTEEVEVGCMGLLKFILYATLFVLLAGKFFTGSFLWELDVPDLRQFIPVRSRANPLPILFLRARPPTPMRSRRTRSVVRGRVVVSIAVLTHSRRRLPPLARPRRRTNGSSPSACWRNSTARTPTNRFTSLCVIFALLCVASGVHTREAHHECLCGSRLTATCTTSARIVGPTALGVRII